MNLDTCTPGQRHVVHTLDRPLVVAAGAGSGKTFTLTQRIAAALLPGEGGRKPFVESLDEVLAITYTNKAAAELRSRIKQQLLDEGLEVEALKADDAWVSTIHGMCSRLLREHALEFGIDPAFELIMGAEAERLFDRALLSAYDRIQPDASGALGRYFLSRPLKTDAPGGHSVSSDVHAVIDCVTAQPGGFAAYVSPEPSKTCRQILRELRDLGDLLESHASRWKKPNKTEQKLIDALPAVFEQLDEALAGRIPNFDEDDFDPAAFIDLVFALPPTSQKFHGPDSKKDDAGFFEEYRSRYGSLGLEAQLCAYQPQMDAMVEFAQEVVYEYRQLKGPERLDNDDLILLAARALADHPDLAQACRDQFKLVMVDEFQDTNRVQVGLVRTIAADDCSNVCMVGDAQQSIYKFRGADVSVFFDFQKQVAALNPSAEVVELPDNFRSHADILFIVDKIFATNDFFGERFLHLEPKGAVNKVADPVFEERPRIEFFVANAGRSIAPARFESAHAVAAHFADLRQEGVEPGDMVLLLGSMSHASLFVEALREEGFQSIITGGSVFAAAVEVQIVAHLLSWWANPLDSESLLALLTSVPFCLDEDCLMALCTNPTTGGRWELARGLQKWDPKVAFGLTAEELGRIDHVRGCLLGSAYRARTQSASVALREVFASSGWADLLESRGAVGLAQSGNIIKSQAVLADLEEGLGLPQVAALFEDHLASAKEAPGSLTTSSSQFVRIMTIHASKGLQFPHVALAELRMGNSQGLSGAQKVGDTFVCMGRQTPSTAELKKATNVVKWMKEQEGFTLPALDTPNGAFLNAEACVTAEEREEAQRLLYVGMTRPSKSLFVSFATKGNPSDSTAPLYVDVRKALEWQDDPSLAVQMLDYGGSAPARLVYRSVDEELVEAETSAPEALCFPRRDFAVCGREVPGVLADRPLCSYSSLSSSLPSHAVFAGQGVSSSDRSNSVEDSMASGGAVSFGSEAVGAEISDEDATSLGLAFHLLAERAIAERAMRTLHLGSSSVSGSLVPFGDEGHLLAPGQETIDRVALGFGVTPDQHARLCRALDRWFSSGCARELACHAELHAEVPFLLSLEDEAGESFVLEGEIDALAYDEEGTTAYLVDYKTGGSSVETSEQLHYKHLFQAQCYALALLAQGFSSVEARFVRVEHASAEGSGEPDVVPYRFEEQELAQLRRIVVEAYRAQSQD